MGTTIRTDAPVPANGSAGTGRSQPTFPHYGHAKPWEGSLERKPSDYQVTAVIPCINPGDEIALVVASLRAQTLRPYILLIDTGSRPEIVARLEALCGPDLELHLLRFNAVRHPSEPVSIACDLGADRADSRFVFFTHTDCFLLKQTVLEELANKIGPTSPCYGHQLSPRAHNDWERHYGHTCLMVDQDRLDRLGVKWKMRCATGLYGEKNYELRGDRPNWPDTELGLNAHLERLGQEPQFSGLEENYEQTIDELIHHVRSVPSSGLYSPGHSKKSAPRMAHAVIDAQYRLEEWAANPLPEVHIPESALPAELTLPAFLQPAVTPGRKLDAP
jgi:hypothetical protein